MKSKYVRLSCVITLLFFTAIANADIDEPTGSSQPENLTEEESDGPVAEIQRAGYYDRQSRQQEYPEHHQVKEDFFKSPSVPAATKPPPSATTPYTPSSKSQSGSSSSSTSPSSSSTTSKSGTSSGS